MSLCEIFINNPPGAYRPLACRPIIVKTEIIKDTGRANKLNLFYLIKPNTFKEHATLDLILPTFNPEILPRVEQTFATRVTPEGDTRNIPSGAFRVVAE